MPRRPLALATLVLALLFALARATPGAVAQPGAPPPLPWAHSTSGMSSQGATFEPGACPQTPEPVPALATARCGFLVVPEYRAHPGGRMIRLAVAIIPAVSKTPAPDPIVYMAGGPGVDPIGQETTMLVDAGVNRDRDLIIMDQRGTRYSVPALLCPEIDQFLARRVGLVYDAASTGREHVDATRACHDRLVNEGIDLAAYNSTENAADFADLRIALGIRQWNVYGTSGGTGIALISMREHPQGIRSVIIDSVIPPDIASLSTTWGSAQEAFANIFAACEQQPACAQRYPELSATFTRLVQELEAQPITTEAAPAPGLPPVTVVIDGGALVQWLVGIGFQPAGIPAAIDALRHGNPQPIAAVRAAAADPAVAGTDGTGLFYGTFCSEWIPYEPASEVLAAGKRAFPEYPDSVLSQAPQLPFMTDDCRVWNVPTAPAAIRAFTHSTIPTLIVSGTFDARTSPALGEHAAQTLPNSTVVNIPGVGHVVVPKSPCAQQVFASFLATPSAPDTRCVATLQPAPFNSEPTREMAGGSTLPRNVVLTLGEVKQILPEMGQETATGEDESALGTPRGTRGVTYATDDGSRRVVISVAQYQSARDASSAYGAAVQASLAAPGGAGGALSNVGEQAFVGVSAQGDETHVGAGARYGELIVIVTLQGYDGTTENRARVTELIRMEAAAATRALQLSWSGF